MDSSGTGGLKIEKLCASNHRVWKPRIEPVLAYQNLDDHIVNDTCLLYHDTKQSVRLKAGTKAKAVTDLILFDKHLEHVRDCQTAHDMWNVISDLFQRHTLLNRLAARRKFFQPKCLIRK